MKPNVNPRRRKRMVHPKLGKREAARIESRARILEVAKKLFIRNGYEQTTMQRIVAEADTSIGNAYFYFENKEQLLRELFETETQDFWELTEKWAAPIPAGPRRLAAIVHFNMLSVFGRNRGLLRLALGNAPTVAIDIVRDYTLERWDQILGENFPSLSVQDRELTGATIFGGNRAVAEKILTGKTEGAATIVARHAVRWTLRGLGVEEREISKIMKTLPRQHPADPS